MNLIFTLESKSITLMSDQQIYWSGSLGVSDMMSPFSENKQ